MPRFKVLLLRMNGSHALIHTLLAGFDSDQCCNALLKQIYKNDKEDSVINQL